MKFFFTRFSFVMTAAIGLAAFATGAAQSRETPVPFFLGQHLFYIPSYAGSSAEMFSGVRIWGNEGTTWAQVETVQGTFDFSKFDQHVAQAQAKDFEIIHTLGQTPGWASARPDEKGNMGLGAAAEPANIQHWANYVRTLAQRYKGRISAYEIMNEPRIPEAGKIWSPGFFSGTASTLASMTQIAAAEIKRVDPAAQVICPAMDGGAVGLKRLDYFLATGAGQYCDVIGFHFYLPTLGIQELRTLIQGAKALMAKHGLQNRPLWDTETGILIEDSGYNLKPKERTGPFSKVFDSAAAGRFAAQFLVVSHTLGVQRTYWFAHDASSSGSTVADKRLNQLNPFGKSLTLINHWLSGNTLEECEETSTSMNCRILNRGVWIGNVYWGKGKSPETWKKLGFKSIQFLNSEILNLDIANVDTYFPRIPEDVVFLAR